MLEVTDWSPDSNTDLSVCDGWMEVENQPRT